MPPKSNAKRKAFDVDAASSSRQAPDVAEPVMPVLASLPEEDATILGQVVSLGHYPRSLNTESLHTATQARKDERNLLQRLGHRKKLWMPNV